MWLKIGLPVVLVVVLGIIGFEVFVVKAVKDSPVSAAVGDCLNVKDFKKLDGNNQPQKIDCADRAANVKVAVRLTSSTARCPKVGYEELTLERPSVKLCMILNVKQGDCVANFNDSNKGYAKVSCTDPTAEVEFVKVAGVSDERVCDGTEAEKVVTYPVPPTTFCLKAK